jgi:prevent-host-death family protein
MPTTIGVREFKNKASSVLRSVREDMAEYIVTLRGEPVAVLRPLTDSETTRLRQLQMEETLAEMKSLAMEVGEAWSSDQSGVEIVSEQRR